MAISALLLSGCQSLFVNNDAPAPFFPSCASIRHAAKDTTPDAIWQDFAGMTRVMLKLRERQPTDERDKLTSCDLAGPDAR